MTCRMLVLLLFALEVARLGVMSSSAMAQDVAPASPRHERVAAAVRREIGEGLFPGAVVLLGRPGEVLYHEAFGDAQVVPAKVAMRKDTLFEVASVTKAVATATAVGICVDDGRLAFDMAARRALPELCGEKMDQVTLTQLGTHTSGLANKKYHEGAKSQEEMFRAMLAASPKAEPGAEYCYACINMILLGFMVERASGMPLDEFCRARIFEPLGMSDTRFGPVPASPRVAASGAPTAGQIEDYQARAFGRPIGNAGLVTTAADLARFCQMMLAGGKLGDVRILSERSHRYLTHNLLDSRFSPRTFGWDMNPKASHRPSRLSAAAYGHSGHTGQSVWIDPEKQVYVIVLTNRNHPSWGTGDRGRRQYEARARIGDAMLEAYGY